MKSVPVSMTKKPSPRMSNLSEITQLVRDFARCRLLVCTAVVSWGFIYIYLPLGPHSKKLDMERFGQSFHQGVLGFSFSQRRSLHFEMIGLFSVPLLKVSLNLGLMHEITVKGKTNSKLSLQTSQLSFLLVCLVWKC